MSTSSTTARKQLAALLQGLVLLVALVHFVVPPHATITVDPKGEECEAGCPCDTDCADEVADEHPDDEHRHDAQPHGCAPGCGDCDCCAALPMAVVTRSLAPRLFARTEAAPADPGRAAPSQPTDRIFRPPRAS